MLKLLDTTTIRAEESDKDGCQRCSGKVRFLKKIENEAFCALKNSFFCRYSMRRELKSKIESITKDVRLALIAQNLCPQGIFVTERTKTFIARLATLESMELQATEVRTFFVHVLIFFIKLIGTLFFLLQLFYWNYLLITGAGCGEWTDVDSAETLRPRQNNDLSKIKGEEGDINTCKRCQGKVSNFSKNADPILLQFAPFFLRSLKPKELHQRATPGTKSAFVASNVALLWTPPLNMLLKARTKKFTAKYVSRRLSLTRRCLRFTTTLL